jgi:hypothetical protein
MAEGNIAKAKTGRFLIQSNGTSGYWNAQDKQTGEFESWLIVYLKYLQDKGVDIFKSEIKLFGQKITVFKTDDGINWQID